MNQHQLWTKADINYGKSQAYAKVVRELLRLMLDHPEAEGLLDALAAQVEEWREEANRERSEADAQLWADLDALTAKAR